MLPRHFSRTGYRLRLLRNSSPQPVIGSLHRAALLTWLRWSHRSANRLLERGFLATDLQRGPGSLLPHQSPSLELEGLRRLHGSPWMTCKPACIDEHLIATLQLLLEGIRRSTSLLTDGLPQDELRPPHQLPVHHLGQILGGERAVVALNSLAQEILHPCCR